MAVDRDETVRQFRTQVKLFQRRLRQELPAVAGLSRSSLQVLSVVSRHPDLTPRDIAEQQRMTSSNVAAALRELESGGFVLRTRDQADGRRVNVSLTPAGTELVADYRTERDTWLGRAIESELTTAEFALLLQAGELMQRLAQFEPILDGTGAVALGRPGAPHLTDQKAREGS